MDGTEQGYPVTTGQNNILIQCIHFTDNLSLVDSVVETHGVRRKLWYRYVNTEGFATLRENPIFEQPPDGYSTTFNMSATFEVSENYGESLTSYLQVPESGNYIFSLSCGDECELWFKEFEGRELSFKQTAASNSIEDEIMLVQLRRWASYNEPDRCLKKQAKSGIYLHKCHLYSLNVYMKDELQFKCLSVGMRGEKATEEDPIQGSRLYAMPPGIRVLAFTLKHPNDGTTKQMALGSTLRITGKC
ncbi:uncharacterized protein LOC110042195 [Orbicella faveolata]|uniref:uncharacterized protein LOC110042195 n=1 Tax=Orbicella faveolata TaxID=48498 RepID=UPI0009E26CE8|nr:uncharacterized protein LOC110042195 [Orbicella faveolata]